MPPLNTSPETGTVVRSSNTGQTYLDQRPPVPSQRSYCGKATAQIHQENEGIETFQCGAFKDEKIQDKRSTDSHAGATQLLPDISPDVVDGYGFQLLIPLNLLVNCAFACSQFPLV